jgi:transcriptional regulator with XRE-family HTH domain
VDEGKRLPAVFFRTEAGSEPVRDWLKELRSDDKRTIGEDIMAVGPGSRKATKKRARKASKMKKANPRIGSKFEDFLDEEGILEDVQAAAIKRVLAAQLEEQRKALRITKSALAKRMKTSRGALDRLFDPDNTSVTLTTLSRAATALGSQIELTLVPSGRTAAKRVGRPKAARKTRTSPSRQRAVRAAS